MRKNKRTRNADRERETERDRQTDRARCITPKKERIYTKSKKKLEEIGAMSVACDAIEMHCTKCNGNHSDLTSSLL